MGSGVLGQKPKVLSREAEQAAVGSHVLFLPWEQNHFMRKQESRSHKEDMKAWQASELQRRAPDCGKGLSQGVR